MRIDGQHQYQEYQSSLRHAIQINRSAPVVGNAFVVEGGMHMDDKRHPRFYFIFFIVPVAAPKASGLSCSTCSGTYSGT